MAVAEEIVANDVGCHAGQMGALQRRGEPLGQRTVTAPPAADVAIAPRLGGEPRQCVVAILDIGEVGMKRPFGFETPAAILYREGIASFSPPDP